MFGTPVRSEYNQNYYSNSNKNSSGKKVPTINVDFTPIKLKTMQAINPNERPYTPSRMKLDPDSYDYNSAGRRSTMNSRRSSHK